MTGGVEAILGAHAHQLREAGHDVKVFAGRGDAELIPELDSRHPKVERVAQDLAAGEDVSEPLAQLRERLRALLSEQLGDREVVLVHNVMTMPFNLAATAALADLALPKVAWTHDLAWVNYRYAAYRRPVWPTSLLGRAQDGTTYVAISQVRQAEICAVMGLAADRVPVVPNGIEPARLWSLSRHVQQLAAQGGFAGADPLILAPVRVTRRKRLELALDAAASLRSRQPELRLVVTGPLGPHSNDNVAYWQELARLRSRMGLQAVVSFLHEQAEPGAPHAVTEEHVFQLYRMADVILLPSESEGFGLPVLEAALNRVPLVCADLPVLREPGPGNFTFPTDATGEEVAQTVAQALSTPAARLRRSVLRTFAWPKVVAAIEQVMERAIGG